MTHGGGGGSCGTAYSLPPSVSAASQDLSMPPCQQNCVCMIQWASFGTTNYKIIVRLVMALPTCCSNLLRCSPFSLITFDTISDGNATNRINSVSKSTTLCNCIRYKATVRLL